MCNDYSVRKYIGGGTPPMEAPIDPNVETRVKDIVYSRGDSLISHLIYVDRKEVC
jgi:hypothetical protein